MKKKKWMIAAALFTAMVSSSMMSVPADAIFQLVTDVPDGYEIFSDENSLYFVSDNGYYPAYRNTLNHNNVLVLTNYRCNIVEIEIPTAPENMVPKYAEIEEKYADVIDTFDQYAQNLSGDTLQITMYDAFDEDGNRIKDPSLVESKRGKMQKMCRELLEAGVVTSASYTPYNALIHRGDYQDFLYLKQLSETEEESLTAFTKQQFGEDITVQWEEGWECMDDHYVIKGFKNADDLFAASAILEEQFAGADAVPVSLFIGGEESYTTGNVNLLTAADACGDVDGNGTISVEDAVSTLTYYAQQSAGLEAKLMQAADTEETAFLAADVNGDGEITVEDAVAILTYYARQSAGLDAAW